MDAPRLIPSDQFAALRQGLHDAAFTTEGICQLTGTRKITKFRTRRGGRQLGVALDSPLAVLIRLFFDEEYVPAEIVEAQLPPTILEPLQACGLLTVADGQYLATAIFYPYEDLWIASDRSASPDGTPFRPRVDAVYPAISDGSMQLTQLVPFTPCARLLEACAGAGAVAALGARHFAQHAWSADILPRCTHYAEFNAALNGLENFSAVTGNLYEATPGLQFDRIVAHPPYVPQEKVELVYRDGGHDGEQILQALVRGLPQALVPGGRLYVLTYATDREEAPLELRVRQWLGEAEKEFDVVVVEALSGAPEEIIPHIPSRPDKDKLVDLMHSLHVTKMVFCSIVVQRHTHGREPFTIRRSGLKQLNRERLDNLLSIATAVAEPDFFDALEQAPLTIPDGVEVQLRQRAGGGGLAPPAVWLISPAPVPLDVEMPFWVYHLMNSINGQRTGREVFVTMQEAGIISPESEFVAFRQALLPLFNSGLLRAPGLTPPPVGE